MSEKITAIRVFVEFTKSDDDGRTLDRRRADFVVYEAYIPNNVLEFVKKGLDGNG